MASSSLLPLLSSWSSPIRGDEREITAAVKQVALLALDLALDPEFTQSSRSTLRTFSWPGCALHVLMLLLTAAGAGITGDAAEMMN